jgi:hypothetical protein
MNPQFDLVMSLLNVPKYAPHTWPYRDVLPGGVHGDAPVRGTHVSCPLRSSGFKHDYQQMTIPQVKSTQVAKNHLSFATAFFQYF